MKNRLLSTLLAFCLMLALLPGTALAANKSGTCGANATWTLDSAGTMTIKGTGAMTADYRHEDDHWKDIRDDIKKIVIQKGITSIGMYTFEDCKNVTSVTIPSGVTSIGFWAFARCSNLSSITFPSTINNIGIYAFFNCKSLTSVTLPNGLPYIDMSVFESCSSLTSVVIPSSVKSVGMNSFANCTSLTSINIPYGVELIGDGAFYKCGKLASIGLPSTLKRVGVIAFSHCDALKDVYYAGTKNQWDKIEMDVNPSMPLKTATKHYNSVLPTPKTYTVTFNANNGSVITKNKSVTSGSTYGDLPVPTRTGYTFSGWYTSPTGGTKVTSSSKVSLTGNQTLYAHWTKAAAKTMTVTFDPNSGAVTTKSKSVTNGSTYGTLPAPTRTGYIFDGWYTSKTGGTKVTSATKVTKTANHTLYAHWSKSRIITVTFDAAGGDVLTEYQTAITGTRYRHLPTPSRSGYHFDGWYTAKTGGVKVTESSKVTKTANHTLYARWTKNNPTVKSRQSGNYQVVIPEDYKVLLYGSETTAAVAKTALAQTGDYTVTCTKLAKLANGTVRYYGKFPKVSSTTSYWFTYSDEMYIN